MKNMKIPHILKGTVYRVSSMMKRLKEKYMLINPFKDELTL